MLVLGLGLGVNTLLGPLVVDAIDYPFTDTVRNETLGLEAITLLLIVPLAFVAGVLALRGHPAAAVVALGPAAYAAYMLVQYVVGPQYQVFQVAVLFHLALFVLSAALLVRAWTLIDVRALPQQSRGWAVVALLLAAFVLSRWSVAFAGAFAADPIPAAPPDATMYWAIFFLDLGIVVPITLVTALGLLMRRDWAARLLFGVVGWFALVPPSVAAMAIVKLLRGDPVADAGDAVVLLVVAVVFGAVALWLYAPLFRRSDGIPWEPQDVSAEEPPRSSGAGEEQELVGSHVGSSVDSRI